MTSPKKRGADLDVTIGARLRQARMERGVSQDRLAAGLGITFQQVQKYEKGTNRISCSALIAIGRVLKIDPLTLLAGLAEPGETPLAITDGTAIRVARLVEGLPDPAGRRAVAAIAEIVNGCYARAAA